MSARPSCLSVCPSVYQPRRLSECLSANMYTCATACLLACVHRTARLSVCPSVRLCVCLTSSVFANLHTCPFISLPACFMSCLPVCSSVGLHRILSAYLPARPRVCVSVRLQNCTRLFGYHLACSFTCLLSACLPASRCKWSTDRACPSISQSWRWETWRLSIHWQTLWDAPGLYVMKRQPDQDR